MGKAGCAQGMWEAVGDWRVDGMQIQTGCAVDDVSNESTACVIRSGCSGREYCHQDWVPWVMHSSGLILRIWMHGSVPYQ